MVMVTPFLKVSIFEDGTMRTTCEGAKSDGKNWMQLLVRCMLGSKVLPDWTVNSPHLRNPEKAAMLSASKLSRLSQDKWAVCSRTQLSTSHVMGSLGQCYFSPMYILIPLMTHWSREDLHAVNARSASTWADHKWVTYDLIVLGWRCLTPPSHVTH